MKTNKSFKLLWLREQYTKLRMNPKLANVTNDQIKKYLLDAYDKRRVVEGRLYNNVTHENLILTQEQFIDKYLNEPYILSGYATFFKNQNDAINISAAALKFLGVKRKENKKIMEASEHGSADYIYYKIVQLTFKVLMNSYYGILGQKDSAFYNSFSQNAITTTGQDLITTSIIGMEAFLSNNTKFNSTDDCINFMYNICTEEKEFKIMEYLDKSVTKEELLEYFISHTKSDVELDVELIKDYIDGLNEEYLNRCFYKNRIIELIDRNSWFKNKIQEMIQYNYGEKPDEEMKPILDEFKQRVIDFCWYNCLFEDRFKRASKDKRQSIITIDTDLRDWVR